MKWQCGNDVILKNSASRRRRLIQISNSDIVATGPAEDAHIDGTIINKEHTHPHTHTHTHARVTNIYLMA